MKYNFCTLFDSYYLSRGLALYESLTKHCHDFHLYIFAYDEKSYNYLINAGLGRATILSLNDLEDDRLLSVKNDRSLVEYYWTTTSFTIDYCLRKYKLDQCSYLDADIYFFDSPEKLLKEVEDGSTLITEHRYTKKYDDSKTHGKYCVQFMTFHNNSESKEILDWWQDACIDWCYARIEDGKFGDQKYLDDWPQRFRGVHELEHLGGGVAPWNVQQYEIFTEDGKLMGRERKTGSKFDVIFYHFHRLKYISYENVDLGVYDLDSNVLELIYRPYIRHLNDINKQLNNEFFLVQKPVSIRSYSLKNIIGRIKENYLLPFQYIHKRLFKKKQIYNIDFFLRDK